MVFKFSIMFFIVNLIEKQKVLIEFALEKKAMIYVFYILYQFNKNRV